MEVLLDQQKIPSCTDSDRRIDYCHSCPHSVHGIDLGIATGIGTLDWSSDSDIDFGIDIDLVSDHRNGPAALDLDILDSGINPHPSTHRHPHHYQPAYPLHHPLISSLYPSYIYLSTSQTLS